MNRYFALGIIVSALVLTAVVIYAVLGGRRQSLEPLADEATASVESARRSAGEEEQLRVTLFFPGEDGRLHGEEHEVRRREGVVAQAEELVQALLLGPRNPALRSPLPGEVTLGGIDAGAEGVLYVDLRSSAPSPPSSGSRREMLTVYCVIDSLALNLPGVERVALLWNGRQSVTFAGHVDTTHPLPPDRRLVAAGR